MLVQRVNLVVVCSGSVELASPVWIVSKLESAMRAFANEISNKYIKVSIDFNHKKRCNFITIEIEMVYFCFVVVDVDVIKGEVILFEVPRSSSKQTKISRN